MVKGIAEHRAEGLEMCVLGGLSGKRDVWSRVWCAHCLLSFGLQISKLALLRWSSASELPANLVENVPTAGAVIVLFLDHNDTGERRVAAVRST